MPSRCLGELLDRRACSSSAAARRLADVPAGRPAWLLLKLWMVMWWKFWTFVDMAAEQLAQVGRARAEHQLQTYVPASWDRPADPICQAPSVQSVCPTAPMAMQELHQFLGS